MVRLTELCSPIAGRRGSLVFVPLVDRQCYSERDSGVTLAWKRTKRSVALRSSHKRFRSNLRRPLRCVTFRRVILRGFCSHYASCCILVLFLILLALFTQPERDFPMHRLLTTLMQADRRQTFSRPVSEADGIHMPTYLAVIKRPMDLGTIKVRRGFARRSRHSKSETFISQHKLDSRGYATEDEAAADIRLVFLNAIEFNTLPGHPVPLLAQTMLADFDREFAALKKQCKGCKVGPFAFCVRSRDVG